MVSVALWQKTRTGLGFKVPGLGLRVMGFRVEGYGVQGSGFRVEGHGV